MLAFAWVRNFEVIKGDVINAKDFPVIGHAWLKIGADYYDPTFDDPIGNTQTRTQDQYRYFDIPKDLFYTNRYDYGTTPESLKTTTLFYRDTKVEFALSKLVEKYKNAGYNLLKPYIFRAKYDIPYNKNLTPELLKNIIPSMEVNGDNYSYTDSTWKTGYIRWLKYYLVDNTNLISALFALDFDLTDVYLMNWKTGNTSEYRLAYDVKF